MKSNMLKFFAPCIALAFSFVNTPTFAQEKIPVELKNVQVNLSIIEPSVSVEKRITDKNSFSVSAGITTLNQFYEENEYTKLTLNPFVKADFRNYYPRKQVKKELLPNSGNYIGLLGGYNFTSIAENEEPGETNNSNAFFMGGVWGIQRNYQSGIHLGLNLGAGFIAGEHIDLGLTGLWSFELGFVLK